MGTEVYVITVCISGSVSSTMLAMMITEMLENEGCEVHVAGARPDTLVQKLSDAPCDLIVTATELAAMPGRYASIPVIDGSALLAGKDVQEIRQEILEALEKTGKLPGHKG